MQSIRVNQISYLDASGSCDEDLGPNAKGQGLLYSWSCLQVQPALNSTCLGSLDAGLFNATQHRDVLALQPLQRSNVIGTVFSVQLMLQDQARTRSASASISVTVIDIVLLLWF